MAEPRRDDRDGHAEYEHAGGHEVAEIVQPEVREAGLATEGDEALRDPVRFPRSLRVGSMREHERVSVCADRPVGAVVPKHDGGGRVELDPVCATVLRCHQHRPADRIHEPETKPDIAAIQIDVTPSQTKQL